MNNHAPVFVKVEDYKQILAVIELIKKNVTDAKKTLNELSALKDEEAAEIESWTKNLENVEQKVADIDRMMVAPHEDW